MASFTKILPFLAFLICLTKCQTEADFFIKSVFDGKVITSTDIVESPGPYTIYATRALNFTKEEAQRWRRISYDNGDPTLVYFANFAEPRMNSFSYYKPCPSCFAATNHWHEIRNGTSPFVSLLNNWEDDCLSNHGGEGNLVRVPCNIDDPQQVWEMIPVETPITA